tara:strand:- start:61 stop:1320 length:1260 start_codon:yes stop_codon:yes gene_type:complete
MKIKTINKICNLERDIELLKKKILTIQIKHLGELTYKNLEKMDFVNIDFTDNEKDKNEQRVKKKNLMEILKMKEEEYNKNYKMNTDNEHINNQLKIKYDVEKQKTEMKNKYINEINIINSSFNEDKKMLEEKILKLKNERVHNLHIKQLHDDKIIFLLDKITHFTEHNNSIKTHIKQTNKEILTLQKICNNKIKIYNIEHKKKYNTLCGGSSKQLDTIAICKNKMKQMKTEKLNCKLLFVEKYKIYLGEFYILCNKYGKAENGVIKDCITFTREQVQNKIDELIEKTEILKKTYYEEMNEDLIKKDYKSEIEELKKNYKSKIEKKNKDIEKILNSIKIVINKYKKKTKIKSRKEIMEYIDDLKKQRLELEYINEDLETKYKLLIELKLNIKPNCLERLNNIKADSLKKIYLKKKECAEN